MNKQTEEYYKGLFEGKQPVVVGQAFVRGEWKNLELIDETRVESERIIRVIWRDEQHRRVTSFLSPNDVIKYDIVSLRMNTLKSF